MRRLAVSLAAAAALAAAPCLPTDGAPTARARGPGEAVGDPEPERAPAAGPPAIRDRRALWSVPLFDPRLPPYPLDRVPRFRDPRAPLDCPHESLVRHRGTHVRYAAAARVHEAFVPRLEAFEALVVALATERFGRPPRRVVHRGAFNCRRTRGRRERVSEHALGNALDLRGFDFGRLPHDVDAPDGLPRHLRRGFRVRVRDHWAPRRTRDRDKARFLHALVERLRVTPGIFRGIVGPPRRRHHDHLHLDVAPWRYALYRVDPLPPMAP